MMLLGRFEDNFYKSCLSDWFCSCLSIDSWSARWLLRCAKLSPLSGTKWCCYRYQTVERNAKNYRDGIGQCYSNDWETISRSHVSQFYSIANHCSTAILRDLRDYSWTPRWSYSFLVKRTDNSGYSDVNVLLACNLDQTSAFDTM